MPKAFPDRAAARRTFESAAAKARSTDPLPQVWIELIQGFDDMTTRGYIAALGTALLAKATDERIDPLALQREAPVRPGLHGYSARTLASHVLVKEGRKIGLDLGLHGDEPLQGNPFTDEERLHRKLPVRYPVELDRLVSALELIESMTTAEALNALAAFVRVRTAISPPAALPLPVGSARLATLITGAEHYACQYSERGRVGQALVAGALDVVLADVRTSSVYASSKKRPGDVRVETPSGTTLSVEVKQKQVDATQVLAFAKALAAVDIPRGMYVAMAKGQKPLHDASITEAGSAEGIAYTAFTTLGQFLAVVVGLAPSVSLFIDDYPANVMRRLVELEASESAKRAWVATVEAAT